MSQDEKTKTTSGYTPSAQEKKISKGLGEAYLPNIGQKEPFPGERVAPLTGAQTGAVEGLEGFTETFKPFQDSPLYGEGGKALQGAISGEGYSQPITPESSARMFESIYGIPGRKEFKETVAPAISEEFAGPGYWGGARARAGMEGAQDLQDWLGTKRGEHERDVFDRNAQLDRDRANRVFGAVDRTPDYLATPSRVSSEALGGRANVFNVASAQQQQGQNVINAEIQKWKEKDDITDQQTLDILTFLAQLRYGTTTTRSVDQASPYQEFMGVAKPAALFAAGVPDAGLFGAAGLAATPPKA